MKKGLFSIVIGIVLLTTGLTLLEKQPPGRQVRAANQSTPLRSPKTVATSGPRKVWSIGILTGSSPFNLANPTDLRNPVITAKDVSDIDAEVVAHPFITREDSSFYMFFTVKNKRTDQGEIGLAESRDGLTWRYRQIVLSAPYHLAYPFVFLWNNQYFMIPEGVDDRSVRLYRATNFPTEWTFEKILIQGESFISASVAHYQETWWMYVGLQGNETLRFYYSSDLMGRWAEHPQSPVVEADMNIARPGGRPFVVDGKLYRLGQDCYPTYGRSVSAFQVTGLSAAIYEEKAVDPPLVEATSTGWSAEGMHHVDAHPLNETTWIAAVDGVQTIE